MMKQRVQKFRSLLGSALAVLLLVVWYATGPAVVTPGVAEAGSGANSPTVAPILGLYPAAQTVYLGIPFTVDVVIDNADRLGGFEFTLDYDPAVLQANTAVLGPFLGSTGRAAAPVGPTINPTSGRLSFGGFSFGPTAGPSGTGTLATITFTPVSVTSNSPVTFLQGQTTDDQGSAQNPLLLSGTVTVGEAPYSVRLPAMMR